MLIVEIAVAITKSPVVRALIEVHESSHWQLALESVSVRTTGYSLLVFLIRSSFDSAWALAVATSFILRVKVKTKR